MKKIFLSLLIGLFLISSVSALEEFGYNYLETGKNLQSDINYSLIPTVNSSDYWDNLDTPADIALNDLSDTLTGSKVFTLGGNTINWRFTNPVGGMKLNWTGGASGHLFELIEDSSGNTQPGTHLLHAEANDDDTISGHFTHNSDTGTALLVDNGIVNFSNADQVILSGYWNSSQLLNGTLVQNDSSPTFQNITVTNTGFISYLGSLLNRITTLFVQDINFNGTLNSVYWNTSSDGETSSWNIYLGGQDGTETPATILDFTDYDILEVPNINGTGSNATFDYFFGDGSQLTNLPSPDLSLYWNSTQLLNGTLVQNNTSPTFQNTTINNTITAKKFSTTFAQPIVIEDTNISRNVFGQIASITFGSTGSVTIPKIDSNSISTSTLSGLTSLNVGGSDFIVGASEMESELPVIFYDDLTVIGKITAYGGIDPPYVSYKQENRTTILRRVRQEITELTKTDIVHFYNKDTNRYEEFIPATCEFYVQAINEKTFEPYLKLIQTINDGKPCYNTNSKIIYYYDRITDTIKQTTEPIYENKLEAELNKETGEFISVIK
jgi:hypothetical protein